ncbi:MAG: hypothetical protein ASARMPRED_007684 [Alectoria sarmentosa]|nr:MAG: hypothetical protein ASARMPRED_007684 [Alectoria sarmentosa]
MDPLSITASLLSLGQRGHGLLNSLSNSGKYPKIFEAEQLEFEIYLGVLEEISQFPLSSKRAIPRVARPCLDLCRVRFDVVQSLLQGSKAKSSSSGELEKAVNKFVQSVNTLRDVVMDDITHDFINEQRHLGQTYMEEIQSLKASTEYLFSLVEQGLSRNTEQSRAGLQELAEKLRSMKGFETSKTTEWRPSDTDPFSFSVTILQAHKDDTEHTVARGKLDTGCDENWISTSVLDRAGLQTRVEPVEFAQSYVAFGGAEFEPTGKVDIDWYATNAGKSNRTSFLVHHAVPFDMVLGKIWIIEESIFVFNKPALALRMGKFTKEEHRIIEENARKKGATNELLVSIRRAEEASARDRLRQQKALSKASTKRPSPTSQSTLSLVPSRTLYPVSGQQLGQSTSPSGSLSPGGSIQSTHEG